MEFKLFSPVHNQKPVFLVGLIVCVITIGAVSCGNSMIPSIETKSVEPTVTPIDGNSAKADGNENTDRNTALSNKVTPIKLKCKDAKEKDDLSLCNTLIPRDLREDKKFMDDFEITYSRIDLDGDGMKEVIAWESGWAGTSGGSLWVLSEKRNEYKQIFQTDTTWSPIILLPSSHHGWKDFAFLQTGGGLETHYISVFHNGRSYTTLDGPELTEIPPDGEILIPKNWGSSVFGPVAGN